MSVAKKDLPSEYAVYENTSRTVVGIAPVKEHSRRRRLWQALEHLFPVSFEARDAGHYAGLNALILIGCDRASAVLAARRNVPCYAILSLNDRSACCDGRTVRFTDSRHLPGPLRGQALPVTSAEATKSVEPQSGDETLATKGGRSVWVRRPAEGGTAEIDFVSLPPPVLETSAHLAGFLNGEGFFRLAPLLSFLLRLNETSGWQPPPLRACFVFDDPSLRSETYGWINFSELAEHARSRHYHAAIATTPLDTWRARSRPSALFRRHAPELSLVVHGNDHLREEMGRAYLPAEQIALLAQALRRVAKLEERHGLEVCRVMEPPHGVLNRRMLEPIGRIGCEAVLVTPHQFLKCNSTEKFHPGFGLETMQCTADGLCILPRIVAGNEWKPHVLLAALLGQPIVTAGHHYDAARGMEWLEQFAATVNGVGSVRWCNLTAIARSNYVTQQTGSMLIARLGARQIILPVPESVQTVVVQRPWLRYGEEELLVASGPGTPRVSKLATGVSAPIPVKSGTTLEIISPNPDAVNPAAVPSPRFHAWPYLRRLLTEIRDRAQPYLGSPRLRDTSIVANEAHA